jgi:XTP/dITP diphosphohydrolase
MSRTIVIATKNKGKVNEFAQAFAELNIEVKSLLDFPAIGDIVEDGDTFEENAKIKAKQTADILGVPVLADDSGLSVAALNGAPGVYSARYAGEHASDEDNNTKLVDTLMAMDSRVEGFSMNDDSVALSEAMFHCALALYFPDKDEFVMAHGTVNGVITNKPHGNGGFGYDPYFWLPQLNCGMAELTKSQKNEISHRAEALKQLIPLLKSLY